MRFFVQIGGEHGEGHESQVRLDKLTAAFVDSLRSNGFIPEGIVAVHDFHTQVLAPQAPLLEGAYVTDAAPTETSGEQAARLTVDFASSAASELADSHNLTDTDFVGIEPSGATGFTVADVRAAMESREEAGE